MAYSSKKVSDRATKGQSVGGSNEAAFGNELIPGDRVEGTAAEEFQRVSRAFLLSGRLGLDLKDEAAEAKGG